MGGKQLHRVPEEQRQMPSLPCPALVLRLPECPPSCHPRLEGTPCPRCQCFGFERLTEPAGSFLTLPWRDQKYMVSETKNSRKELGGQCGTRKP